MQFYMPKDIYRSRNGSKEIQTKEFEFEFDWTKLLGSIEEIMFINCIQKNLFNPV